MFSHVEVNSIDRIDENTVALGIDLTEYPQLRNPRLLRKVMDAYVASMTNLLGMSAAIRGNELTIVARGHIDEQSFTHIKESMK